MNKQNKNIELFSFDIFDTLITRRVAVPNGIFTLMQEQLCKLSDYDSKFTSNFYSIRIDSERYARDYYKKNFDYDDITFDEIYKYIQEQYSISDDLITQLKDLEIKTELDNIIGIEENIEKIKNLVSQKKRVILISDMYYNTDILHKFLSKIDNIFDNIPIYVSSQYKKSKYNGNLYKVVKESENIKYNNWYHIGDSEIADIKPAKKLGINTLQYCYTKLMPYEKELIELYPNDINIQLMIGTSKLTRLNKQEKNQNKYDFGASLSAPILYNYLCEVIDTALNKGYKTLYFIARDGYIPKLIADTIIEAKNIPLKTKYLYGSRQAFRIPNESNYDFFININFVEYNYKLSWEFLSYRLNLPLETLSEFFNIKSKTAIFSEKQREYVKNIFLTNKALKNTIVHSFDNKRKLFIEYLKQEMDFSEDNILFVEVNGSGKTQVVLSDYINEIKKCNVYMYYITVSPDIVKYDVLSYVYCTKPRPYSSMLELICRTNYGQTIGYKKENNIIVPIIEEYNNDAMMKWGYNEHIQGILDFTKSIVSYHTNIFNKEIFYTYFDFITQKCDKNTSVILGDVPFLIVGKENEIRKAAPELTVTQIIKYFLLQSDLTKFSQYPELSYARGNKIINYIKLLKNKFNFILNMFIELKLFILLKTLKNEKIVFWGASIFLESFIKRWGIKSKNIIGIIDKNPNRQGQQIEQYKIVPPEQLCELNPKYLIMTIKNRHQKIYKDLQSKVQKDYKDITLLPDIFEKG